MLWLRFHETNNAFIFLSYKFGKHKMKKKNIVIGLAGLIAMGTTAVLLAKSVKSTENQPKTVDYVDLKKYLGKWYDIAHYPSRFQKNTSYSQANYSLRSDGNIEVFNTCLKNGKPDDVKGKAWIIDKTSNAKLKVQFFWPFAGDYWILELADDYRFALVGEPKREYLWILSRTPELNDKDKNYLLQRIQYHGYTTEKLHWEKQD
jgi:apolipoprotein D and lipocalin family protein